MAQDNNSSNGLLLTVIYEAEYSDPHKSPFGNAVIQQRDREGSVNLQDIDFGLA